MKGASVWKTLTDQGDISHFRIGDLWDVDTLKDEGMYLTHSEFQDSCKNCTTPKLLDLDDVSNGLGGLLVLDSFVLVCIGLGCFMYLQHIICWPDPKPSVRIMVIDIPEAEPR